MYISSKRVMRISVPPRILMVQDLYLSNLTLKFDIFTISDKMYPKEVVSDF